MKRKKQIEERIKEMGEVKEGLTPYDLGYRYGYRNALKWVLKNQS